MTLNDILAIVGELPLAPAPPGCHWTSGWLLEIQHLTYAFRRLVTNDRSFGCTAVMNVYDFDNPPFVRAELALLHQEIASAALVEKLVERELPTCLS